MSGTYIGVLVSPVERRGTWAEYESSENIGVLVSPVERRGTWAEYGEDVSSGWRIGTFMSGKGWSVS